MRPKCQGTPDIWANKGWPVAECTQPQSPWVSAVSQGWVWPTFELHMWVITGADIFLQKEDVDNNDHCSYVNVFEYLMCSNSIIWTWKGFYYLQQLWNPQARCRLGSNEIHNDNSTIKWRHLAGLSRRESVFCPSVFPLPLSLTLTSYVCLLPSLRKKIGSS